MLPWVSVVVGGQVSAQLLLLLLIWEPGEDCSGDCQRYAVHIQCS